MVGEPHPFVLDWLIGWRAEISLGQLMDRLGRQPGRINWSSRRAADGSEPDRRVQGWWLAIRVPTRFCCGRSRADNPSWPGLINRSKTPQLPRETPLETTNTQPGG
jgi:hypothetical protein